MKRVEGGDVAPVKVLILALGGEGGGVLARWLVEAGLRTGHVVQSTSIPGVAQRTGATSYYVEWLPVDRDRLGGQEPVLCLSPMAGDLDLLVSSELLEAARAAERGLPDPERTLVLASRSRAHTVAEKSAPADGRLSSESLLAKVRAAAGRVVDFDMQSLARDAGTVISAVMFGAIHASGRLSLSRGVCEDVIRAGTRGVEASLRGFELGAQAVQEGLDEARAASDRAESARITEVLGPPSTPEPPGSVVGDAPPTEPGRTSGVAGADDGRPAGLVRMLAIGEARLRDYQDDAYAAVFRDRVLGWADVERQHPGASPELPVSVEAARQLARWMAYEDVIRVADLKIRHQRFTDLESQATGGAGGVVRTWDYLKPGVEEIVAVLPPAPARALHRLAARRGWQALGRGLRLETTGVGGLLAMRLLAGMRRWRRRGTRFAEESALIARWADSLTAALRVDHDLAAAIAQAPSLVKGYSDTHARGRAHFLQVLEHRIEGAGSEPPAQRAAAIRRAVSAARADAAGIALAGELGLPAPEPVAQPIRIIPRRRPRADVTS